MKTFKLWNPASLDEAIGLLPSRRGATKIDDVRVLAGGQDLIPEMKEHLVEPEGLVALAGVPGLAGIELAGQRLRVGAMTTLTQVAEDETVRRGWTAVATRCAATRRSWRWPWSTRGCSCSPRPCARAGSSGCGC